MDKNGQSGGTSRWRVCYQRGLPRLVLENSLLNVYICSGIIDILGRHMYKRDEREGLAYRKNFNKCVQQGGSQLKTVLCKASYWSAWIFNRSSIARAVLQTHLSLIDYLINWVSHPFPPNLQNIITPTLYNTHFTISTTKSCW